MNLSLKQLEHLISTTIYETLDLFSDTCGIAASKVIDFADCSEKNNLHKKIIDETVAKLSAHNTCVNSDADLLNAIEAYNDAMNEQIRKERELSAIFLPKFNKLLKANKIKEAREYMLSLPASTTRMMAAGAIAAAENGIERNWPD